MSLTNLMEFKKDVSFNPIPYPPESQFNARSFKEAIRNNPGVLRQGGRDRPRPQVRSWSNCAWLRGPARSRGPPGRVGRSAARQPRPGPHGVIGRSAAHNAATMPASVSVPGNAVVRSRPTKKALTCYSIFRIIRLLTTGMLAICGYGNRHSRGLRTRWRRRLRRRRQERR